MKTQTNSAARAVTGKLVAFSLTGAYLAVLLFGVLLNSGKASPLDTSFVIYLHPVTYAVVWAVLSAILVVYGSISKAFVYRFTWLAAMGYALVTAACAGSFALTFALCGLVALMTVICGRALREETASKKPASKVCSVKGGRLAVSAKDREELSKLVRRFLDAVNAMRYPRYAPWYRMSPEDRSKITFVRW
jgi:hypothetical protein